MRIYIDFETQSSVDLPSCGQELYLAADDFRAYLLGYAIDDGPVHVVRYPERGVVPGWFARAARNPEVVFVAHNAPFDRGVWRTWFGADLTPKTWSDTSARCRQYGVPANLDSAARFFGRGGKDQAGKRINEKYYKPGPIPESDLDQIAAYCATDVEELRALDRLVPELCELNTEIARLTDEQNVEGIRLDPQAIRSLVESSEKLVRRIEEDAAIYGTYGPKGKLVVTSSDQVKKWVWSNDGILLPTIAQKDLEDYLTSQVSDPLYKIWAALGRDTPFGPWTRTEEGAEVLRIISSDFWELSSVWAQTVTPRGYVSFEAFSKRYRSGKPPSMLSEDAWRLVRLHRARQSKGLSKIARLAEIAGLQKWSPRVTSYQVFHGAHTGRPAGRGINLHNVTRYALGDDGHRGGDAVSRITSRETPPEDGPKRLGSMLWCALGPDRKGHVVVRSDLSAIEPRVGAWLRNDRRTLRVYEDADAGRGLDEYTQFGQSMKFDPAILRPLSKIVILAACYGQGAEGLRTQCRQYGVPDPGEREAERILRGYHDRNPSVKAAWFELVEVAVRVIQTGTTVTHRNGAPSFSREEHGGKAFLVVRLPSGRVKGYANVCVERTPRGYQTFSYSDPKNGFRVTMRPPMLYENLVQMMASDVLYAKVLEIERAGLARCMLTIYDEGIFSAPSSKAKRIETIMKAPCSFMPGMPVNSKTTVTTTLHKGDVI